MAHHDSDYPDAEEIAARLRSVTIKSGDSAMFSQQLNWVFYVTLAYGVVMIALAAYVILLLVQDSKITKSNPDEQK
jgi:hypothetical protein